MATPEQIAEEKQRLTDRLAKIDAEHAKLSEQLSELETVERVLARFAGQRKARGEGHHLSRRN